MNWTGTEQFIILTVTFSRDPSCLRQAPNRQLTLIDFERKRTGARISIQPKGRQVFLGFGDDLVIYPLADLWQ